MESANVANAVRSRLSLSQQYILAQATADFVPVVSLEVKFSGALLVDGITDSIRKALMNYPLLRTDNTEESLAVLSIPGCINSSAEAISVNRQLNINDKLFVLLQSQTEEDHTLTLVANAMFADTAVLQAVFTDAYNIYSGKEIGSRDVIHFSDYIYWQESLLEENTEASKFWKSYEQYDKHETALHLRSTSSAEIITCEKDEYVLPEGYIRKINAFCQENNCAFETPLMLCYLQLLKYHSTGDGVLIGMYSSERYNETLRDIPGPLSRMFPLFFDGENNNDIASLITQLEVLRNDITAWSEYCPAGIVAPDLAFAMNDLTGAAQDAMAYRKSVSLLGRFRMLLNCCLTKDALQLAFIYTTVAFDSAAVHIMREQYLVLLDNMILHGHTHIRKGSLYKPMDISAFEQHFHMQLSQDAPVVHASVTALFEEQAAKFPDKTALTFEGVDISYSELNKRANRLAHALKVQYGMEPGDITGVVLDRSINQVIAFLAAMKASTIYLPLEPKQPVARQESIIRDAEAKILILDSDNFLKGAYNFFEGNCFVIDIQEESLELFDENPETGPGLDDSAYLIYTSGSTGTPKGVEIGHYSLANYSLWFTGHFGISAKDSTIIFSSLCYDLSYSALWPALISGCQIYLEGDDVPHRPEYLLEKIVKEQVTFAKMTPSHFQMLINGPQFAETVAGNNLRLILLGGEQINVIDLQRWFRHSPDTIIMNHYGPTETTIGVAVKTISRDNIEQFSKQPVIGRPIGGNQILLLDEDGWPVPPGIAGELAVAGPGLAKGYYRQPETAAIAFREHPFQPGARIYHTGDVGVWSASGDIIFLGRKDSQIKVRGFRIEPVEIEKQLLSFPGIESAKVILLDNSLLAIIKDGQDNIRIPEIQAHLKSYLPHYMLPQQYLRLPVIPVNANGKMDLSQIRMAIERQLQNDADYEPPRNKEEECLVSIFKEILRKKNIGITDDFFQLGGDSLRAVQVLTLIYQRMQLKAEVRMIFDHPTIKELADVLRLTAVVTYQEITLLGEQEYYHLSHEQKRLWILNQYEPRNISYNRPASYLLHGALNIKALESAFTAVIARHESLRTTYHLVDGTPMQRIETILECHFGMEYQDLSGDADPIEAARQQCNRLAAAPFDLSRGPLIRVALFKLAREQYVLSFVLHHIVSDAWSMAILTNELFLFYNNYSSGAGTGLSPLRVQYKDYAHWQSAQISGDGAQAYKRYWMNMFRDEVPVLLLPEDQTRPAYRSYQGGREIKLLSRDINNLLQEVAMEQGVSLYMLLLTLVNVLLFKTTGQTDIVIGSPVAGRDHPDLQGQIGIYLNTLPVRMKFSRTDTLQQLLLTARDQVLSAFEHRIYPFDLLLEDLQLSWDTSRSPLFDVALVLQNVNVSQQKMADGLDGVTINGFDMDFNTSAIDLRIEFTAYDDGLGMVIDYNSDVFSALRIQRLMAHFETLAASLRTAMSVPLSKINCLPLAEKKRLLTNFGAGATTDADAASLDVLFRDTVHRNPADIALVYEGQQMSYLTLDREIDKLANYLINTANIRPGDFVCVLMEKSMFFIVAALAVFRSGGIYVPIDPEHPADRKKHIITDTGARVLLTSAAYVFDVDYFTGAIMAVDLQLDTLPVPVQPVSGFTAADAVAYVIYTSGSTGTPKGVMIQHGSILRRVLYCNNYLRITAADHILQFAAQGFDASLYEIFMALIPGGRLVITDERSRKSIPAFLSLLETEQVTVATLPPAFLKIIDKERMPGVRILVSTGEAALIEDAVYYAGFKEYYNGYGPTEACIGASFYRVQSYLRDHYQQRNGIPIGLPFADTGIYTLDEDMNLTGVGVPGEIYVASSCLATGYLNDPDLTAARFLPNPFSADDGYDRIYRTGDTGRWNEDGVLEYIGRVDNQVQINGIRVEPNEVAAHLLKHPAVSAGAVIFLEGKGLIACVEKKKRGSFWPDVNTVNLFDDLLYHAMGKDNARLEAYAKAFAKYLPGKTVLDVGTGKDALLARIAVENGAGKVYAVEMDSTAYEQARQLIEKENLQEKIILIKGDIRKIELPEPVDYLIHDLSGNIGGAAGASIIINSAKRFLKNKEQVIPQQYLTHAAAYCLDQEKFDFSFEAVPAGYVSKIFEQTGYPFDVRLCINEVEEKHILSARADFETIDFRYPQPENSITEIILPINKDTLFTGLVLGLNVTVEDGLVVDNMRDGNTILPVYIPLFHPGIMVAAGDIIRCTISRELSGNGLNPDFHLKGSVSGLAFEYSSYNHANSFRQSAFYRELFSEQGQMLIRPEFSPEAIRNYLRQKVPVYMVPQKIIAFEKLPLNINGKVDVRRILEELELDLEATRILPATDIEQQLAAIWELCLETGGIGVNENFFERGANSLRVIRALKLLEEAFPRSFQISDIFSYPTIGGLRDLLAQQGIGRPADEVEVLEL
jgi:amino acid adenylation domain-containing protein